MSTCIFTLWHILLSFNLKFELFIEDEKPCYKKDHSWTFFLSSLKPFDFFFFNDKIQNPNENVSLGYRRAKWCSEATFSRTECPEYYMMEYFFFFVYFLLEFHLPTYSITPSAHLSNAPSVPVTQSPRPPPLPLSLVHFSELGVSNVLSPSLLFPTDFLSFPL